MLQFEWPSQAKKFSEHAAVEWNTDPSTTLKISESPTLTLTVSLDVDVLHNNDGLLTPCVCSVALIHGFLYSRKRDLERGA